MITERTIQIQDRINEDYEKLIHEVLLLTDENMINKAAEIAFYNKIKDFFFDNLDSEFGNFKGVLYDKILNYPRNIIEKLYNTYLNHKYFKDSNFFNDAVVSELIVTAFTDWSK